jgi:hypothetical protein
MMPFGKIRPQTEPEVRFSKQLREMRIQARIMRDNGCSKDECMNMVRHGLTDRVWRSEPAIAAAIMKVIHDVFAETHA